MNRVAGFLVCLVVGICSAPAESQTLINSDRVQVSFENQMLRGAILRDEGYSHTSFMGDRFRFRKEHLSPGGNYLAAYPAQYYGLERYELSPSELLLTGIGAGAQLGFFAGAVGNLLGWWEEDTSWMLMGAMSALGGLWAGTKMDDPNWRFQFKWEDDPMTIPTE